MIRILLLSAGTNACYHVAKTLKEFFGKQFFVVGVDINEQYLIQTCNYIDKFYKVPYSLNPKYYSTILEICKREKINYLLPSFDIEQKLFYLENKDLLKLKVKSFGISKETLKIYKNKYLMNKFLDKNGFKIPKLFTYQTLLKNDNYFVKPINGVGSQNAQVMKGCDILIRKLPNVIIQENCNKPEYTLECFNYKGKLRTITRERIESKSGVCIKTYIFNSLELQEIAEKFI